MLFHRYILNKLLLIKTYYMAVAATNSQYDLRSRQINGDCVDTPTNKPSKKVLEWLINKMLLQEELNELPTFSKTDNIRAHISILTEKFDELHLNDDARIKAILKSLDKESLIELKAQQDFENLKLSYDSITQKLIELHGEKQRETDGYIQMLKIKQQPEENLRDFASRIRITGYNVLFNQNSEKKEAIYLMTFINGIIDRDHAKILREIKPLNLEAAYNCIKKIKPGTKQMDQVFAFQKHKTNDIQRMQDLMLKMMQEINNLKREIMDLKKHRDFRTNSYSESHRNQRINFNNKTSDIHPRKTLSNDRPKRTSEVICYNCQKSGHIARNCYAKAQPRHQLNKLEEDSYSDANTDDVLDSEEFLNQTCSTIDPSKDKNVSGVNVVSKKETKYPQFAIDWENYITGKTSVKPQEVLTYAQVLTSTTNSNSKRTTKPIIGAKSNNDSKLKILIDTGAECNIINLDMARALQSDAKNELKFLSKKGALRCANGSTMSIEGYACFPLHVGTKSFQAKFCVVKDVQPMAILGMKTLKDEKFTIRPHLGHVSLKNEYIPFLENQEN